MEDSSYFTSKVYFNVVKEYSAAMSGHIYIYILISTGRLIGIVTVTFNQNLSSLEGHYE